MKTWIIPVTWEMCGTVPVDADTLEDAMRLAEEDESIPLPDNGSYVDASWSLSSDEVEFIRQCYNQNQPDEESEKGIEDERGAQSKSDHP